MTYASTRSFVGLILVVSLFGLTGCPKKLPPDCAAASPKYGCDAPCLKSDGTINAYMSCEEVEGRCACVPRLKPCASSTPELGCDAECLRDDGSPNPDLRCTTVGDACACAPPEPISCGGITGIQCPAGMICVDDPNDTCDPNAGGADCPGICVRSS